MQLKLFVRFTICSLTHFYIGSYVHAMANNDQLRIPPIENIQRSEDNLHATVDIPTEDLEPGPECCIYKVPKRMRIANEEAYSPQLISIGPFHHGNAQLARMERQKLRYYKKFSERTSEEILEEFSTFIEKNMKRICRCYDAEFEFKTTFEISEFIKMILYDAVFILEFFLRSFEKEVSDFLFSKKWVSLDLTKDLILLENQLPFFVLKDLYNLAFTSPDKSSFLHLVCSHFNVVEGESLGEREIKHFTDLIRSVTTSVRPEDSDESISHIYSAVMLSEAGMKFKALDDQGDHLLNIKFDKGVLHLPRIYVEPSTENIFRNIMAFEQCHDSENAYFCSYIQLLDYLVDTAKDVDILIKQRILLNGMGSSQALADMINKLMVGVAQIPLCFDRIGRDLNKYYDNSCNRKKATLKHVYFNNLWRGTGTVAAFAVVLLTLTQTILAILDRAMPKK